MTRIQQDWASANQRYLSAALAELAVRLHHHSASLHGQSMSAVALAEAEAACRAAAALLPAPAALERLATAFNLTSFECNILLLCAGVALDSRFPAQCSAAQNDPIRSYPTFALALTALPGAHWSATLPDAPLRRWRLIEVLATGAVYLTSAPLRIDERVLHYLQGMQYLDERLTGLVQPAHSRICLSSSQAALAEQVAALWSEPRFTGPPVQLCGGDAATRETIASSVCQQLGMGLSVVAAARLPTNASKLEAFLRLWRREAVLSHCALLLDCDSPAVFESAREYAAAKLIEQATFPLLVAAPEHRSSRCALVTFPIPRPNTAEQRLSWQRALGPNNLNGQLNRLLEQFTLSPAQISAVGASSFAAETDETTSPSAEFSRIWNACRVQSRPQMDDLAQRIESTTCWDDLVLPQEQIETLAQIAVHVRQRFTVYEHWGFAYKGQGGLGISALFAGPSGTGKTLAAEVLANELQLDLYRIDLSQVVSKYIGGTEKNLRRVFDAAESGGAVLLFDKADALFGKRSEVKDSHDRYANIEVSYLLQRMEAYRGLAILTTDMQQSFDYAFLRRIRFMVRFPFPDLEQRAKIWQRVFPAAAPKENLVPELLAQLNVTGGSIRNIALGAAFLAADEDSPIRMEHLLRAAKVECAKLEKPLSDAEVQGWV